MYRFSALLLIYIVLALDMRICYCLHPFALALVCRGINIAGEAFGKLWVNSARSSGYVCMLEQESWLQMMDIKFYHVHWKFHDCWCIAVGVGDRFMLFVHWLTEIVTAANYYLRVAINTFSLPRCSMFWFAVTILCTDVASTYGRWTVPAFPSKTQAI